MDNQYIKYLNQFGGSAEDYISKEDYNRGVESIKKLAKEYSGSFNTNKYLKWVIANTGDVDVREYIDESANAVDFSGFSLKKLPDLSSFGNIIKVVATNAGLTEFPDGEMLPPNVDNIILSKNQIPELTFKNFDKLNKLKVILAMDNPYTKIDVDNLVNFIKNSESIFTIGLSPNEVKNISNYDEYFGKLSELREELGSYDFPVIEPFGFDFND
jgi:Leucine-rich repeat (LRR) protein